MSVARTLQNSAFDDAIERLIVIFNGADEDTRHEMVSDIQSLNDDALANAANRADK